jgi:PAS domain S-box-containing protein
VSPDDQHTSAVAARLAAIVENLADAVVGTDRDRLITDWNPAAERLFGYGREAVVGRHASMLVPPALREESERVWREVQRGADGFIRVETERMRRDGTIVDVELTMVRVDDPDASLACSATYRDITQRKRTERDLTDHTMRLKALAIAERSRPAWLGPQPDEREHEQELVEQVVDLVRLHLEMDVAWLGELTEDEQIFHAVAGHAFDFEPGRVTPRDETICSRLIARVVPEVIPDTRQVAAVAQLPGVLEGVASYVGVPVWLPGGELFGTLCAAGSEPTESLSDHNTGLLHVLAAILGDQIDHQRTRVIQACAWAERATLSALLAALDARDQYTGSHSQAVVELARAVAAKLGLTPDEIESAGQVALLHDLGKVGVPDTILQKPGPLTALEWELMRQHPAIGARIVSAIEPLSHLAPAVHAEHERWDGCGYPDGLAGEEIPIAARITLVCDAYHAMISDRPYRLALGGEHAIEELREHSGRSSTRSSSRRCSARLTRSSRVGAHAAASDEETPGDIRRSSSSAPRLCSGSLRLPHLGDCTHEGQPSSHRHSLISRRASATRRWNCS